ncbi:hypothetical protein B0H10DRAFT_2362502 [Mycena sp. CBHHK59/15]|nr:hypothetical protein B0H10DRAFT_2362502 [Mycena sp. CBHHK59/15]
MAALAPAAAPAAAPVAQTSSSYCHQKPKHGTHPYCSKTCAAQTATLCNYCQKKPKFQNYDYCGKNCASLAAATTTAASGNHAAKSAPSAQVAPKTSSRPNANTVALPAPANPLLDPVQLAKLVAQHIPQVQSFLAAVGPAQPVAAAPVATAPLPPPANLPAKPKNNPFLNASKQVLSQNAPGAPPSGAPVQPLEPLDCLIPGCGQPVHVDASGAQSDYCSKKHREEAVSLGLASPCIMCLALPQSDTDYFCGRECREEAMNKQEL